MVSLREGLMLGAGGVVSLVGAGGKTSLMFRLARELAFAGETVLTTTTTKIHTPSPEQSDAVFISESAADLSKQVRQTRGNPHHVTAAAGRLSDPDKLVGFAPDVIREIWDRRHFSWIIVEADGAAGRPLKAPGENEPVIPTCTAICVGLIGLSGVGHPSNSATVFRSDQFHRLSGLGAGATVTPAAVVEVLIHDQGIFKNAPGAALRIAFCNQADNPRDLAVGRQIADVLTRKKHTGINRVVIGQILFDPPVLEFYDLKSTS